MQRSLTKGPITGSILLFALPLMLAYLLSLRRWVLPASGSACPSAGRWQMPLALDTI